MIVGGFIDAIFHELGHALFDILNIPVFGREEDAADQFSAFLMLQFGKDVARVTIRGAAFTYLTSKNPRTRTEFADEHGAPAQRFFNYICLAYGGEPDAFREYVDRGVLPKARAEQCPREYRAGAPRVRQDHPAAHRPGADEEGPVDPVAAAESDGRMHEVARSVDQTERRRSIELGAGFPHDALPLHRVGLHQRGELRPAYAGTG